MSSLSDKLLKAAATALDRGQPSLFKRLSFLSEHIARSDRTDTDGLLDDALEDEREDEPPAEIVDADDDGDTEIPDDREKEEDDDVEGFFPMGALPQKERRQGPHPKDVAIGKPDWWNPSR